MFLFMSQEIQHMGLYLNLRIVQLLERMLGLLQLQRRMNTRAWEFIPMGGKNIEIGSRASVTAQGKDAVGVYSDNAGETNFLGSARITGNLYSLESEGDGSKIDLSAGGTKVITGNMLSADGGNINVEMDTGDSLFTGASIVQDADRETDISMSNGGGCGT